MHSVRTTIPGQAVLAAALVLALALTGSCDRVREMIDRTDTPSPQEKLRLFDRMVFENGYRKVSLVSVVDMTAEAEQPAAKGRERTVRAELMSYLTRYQGAQVLEPSPELIQEVGQQIQQTGSGALDRNLGQKIAEQTDAEVIVNALISGGGERVTIYATTAQEGRVLYTATLSDWPEGLAGGDQQQNN